MLGLKALVDLLEDLIFDLIVEAVLPGGFRDGAWRQVQINLVNDLRQVALHKGNNDRLCKFLSVRLAAPIMLLLDMQVQRPIATIQLATVPVGARIVLLDHRRRSTVMLFPVLLESALERTERLHVLRLLMLIQSLNSILLLTRRPLFVRHVVCLRGRGSLALFWNFLGGLRCLSVGFLLLRYLRGRGRLLNLCHFALLYQPLQLSFRRLLRLNRSTISTHYHLFTSSRPLGHGHLLASKLLPITCLGFHSDASRDLEDTLRLPLSSRSYRLQSGLRLRFFLPFTPTNLLLLLLFTTFLLLVTSVRFRLFFQELITLIRLLVCERFQVFAELACGRCTFGAVIVGDDAGDVLVGESEHLGQEVVLVEVLHVVDGGKALEVVLGNTLYFSKNPLILDETCPEFRVIVLTALKRRRLVHNFHKILVIFQSNGRPTHKKVRWNLRSHTLI